MTSIAKEWLRHPITRRILVVLFVSVVLGSAGRVFADQASVPKAALHATTDWRIEPYFALDALCFLNVLTGDPFYVAYYKDDYARFQPQLTPGARNALADLKRKIKDEKKQIVSAFLTLYFSASTDKTLDDLLATVNDSAEMRRNLQKTPYYDEADWRLYESVRADLRTALLFLKQIRFDVYWTRNVLPNIQKKIAAIKIDLPKYNVVREVEKFLGFPLPSNVLTVYLLHYSQPHGIRITGLRFLTADAYPFKIVMRNAVHEPMHPPYDLAHDRDLREALDSLRADPFLMDKLHHHDSSFGYNSFEALVEEDCVQALDQTIEEKLDVALEAHRRWKENDNGLHVLAVALYSLMKEAQFNGEPESFRDWLLRMIRSGKLRAGSIKPRYDAFFSVRSK